ncbi:MAG TPA: SDR family NAD(P)-dependent oxidoreductase, partial [Pseudobacter sp.]|nr:SDR family NAD(P)-dependent oxidoreductase [Pseudobacter sp.]
MEDRIVLITGATGGIGKAAATNLAQKGFTVVIHGRDAAKTKAAAQEIKNATGNQRIDMLVADLFSLQEVKEMAE